MQAETSKKPSLKELRLARRWAPQGSTKFEHPDGKSAAFIAPLPRGCFQVIGYWGTAGNASFNYSYRTQKEAEDKIVEFFKSISARKESMTKRKQEQLAAVQRPIKAGDYVSVTQTAKLIRAQLAAKFAGVKFSVTSKSYSGGASIDIYWNDGPTDKRVQEIVGPFGGSDFDGMVDLKYSVKAWLNPDGSASFGYSAGTGNTRGSDPGYDHPKPHADSIMVHFGADFIFTHRHLTKAFIEPIAKKVSERYG